MPRKLAATGSDGTPTTVRYPIESVTNAASLLSRFKGSHELRLSDVAESLAVSPSTAHRLLSTLEAAGMVDQNPTTRCYEPGPALRALAEALTPNATRWEGLRPYLMHLSQRLGETVNLVVLLGDEAAFVESVEAQVPLKVGSRVGVRMPASCVSGGKALLAELSDTELKAVFPSEKLQQLTTKSIGTRTELMAELGRVRKRGWATNFGESETDVSGVAVTVSSRDGKQPFAIAVAAPRSRLSNADVKVIVSELQKTADLLASIER